MNAAIATARAELPSKKIEGRFSISPVSATVFADVNVAHPFREGNGRVTKVFLRDVAGQCGFRFDFDQVSREEWNEMASLSMPGPDESQPRPGAAYEAFMAMVLPGGGQGPGRSEDAEVTRLVDLSGGAFPMITSPPHFPGKPTAAGTAALTPPVVGR